MADYAITGKKGSGKSLLAIGIIRDALRSGRRVATNLDVHLDGLFAPHNRATYTRLPDRPIVDDFEAIGRGQDGVVEDDNGIIVMDETSTFFNSRAYGDKTRQPMLDWLVHSRKLGWDVYYICQGLAQIDKQLRETMIEYHIPVKRTDKWPIPILTPVGKLIGLNIRFPKYHIGNVKHGCERDSMVVDRKWYRGVELYPAYDTQQLFLDREHPKACGLHSRLSAWHVKGRYLGWWAMSKPVLIAGLMMGAVVGVVAGGYGGYEMGKPKPEGSAVSIDTSRRVVGVVSESGAVRVFFDGGESAVAKQRRQVPDGDQYLVGDKWVLAK